LLTRYSNSADSSAAAEFSLDLTFNEAMRVSWRLSLPVACVVFSGCRSALLVPTPSRTLSLLTVCGTAVFLYSASVIAFVPRLTARPYQNFRLQARRADGTSIDGIDAGMRWKIAAWIIPRQAAGFAVAWFLMAPLNIFLSLMAVHAENLIAVLAVIFVVCPLTIKLLVGHAFSDFTLEVARRRGRALRKLRYHPSLPLEQHHPRRYAHIQRRDLSAHRDLHQKIAVLGHLSMQPPAFSSQDNRSRIRVFGFIVKMLASFIQAVNPIPVFLQFF
jgi:hypothetical protein